MNGTVFLVGAGPGDPRLLTVGAMECMKRAEVVVYDHLADESILSYAPADAELIYVGKQSCKHTMRQEDINVLLADKAAEGKTVVRLKGGDPFVFGRGGGGQGAQASALDPIRNGSHDDQCRRGGAV